jgi:hypothetical protein
MTTVQLPSDEEIAVAEALGELTAQDGGDLMDCPYPWDCQGADRVLRMRWAMAFAAAAAAGRSSFLSRKERAKVIARRIWYGDEQP